MWSKEQKSWWKWIKYRRNDIKMRLNTERKKYLMNLSGGNKRKLSLAMALIVNS